MSVLHINIQEDALVQKISQHLAVIGKRAKDGEGNSLFSNLTTSSAENVVWSDYIRRAAETLVASLAQLSGSYSTTNGTITFRLISERWKEEGSDNIKDITEALRQAVESYLWTYSVMSFLDTIHPTYNRKYAPIYSSSYERQLQRSLSTILDLAFLKRRPKISTATYDMIRGEIEQ